MTSVTELRSLVFEYLGESIDRKTFTHRFAELSYDIRRIADTRAIELSNAIQAYLAPAVAGLISEEQVRHSLADCMMKSVYETIHIEAAYEATGENPIRVSAHADFSTSPVSIAELPALALAQQ